MTLWQLTCGVFLSLVLMALSGALIYGLSYFVLVILPKKEMKDEQEEERPVVHDQHERG